MATFCSGKTPTLRVQSRLGWAAKPIDVIEVTPEMIQAGEAAILEEVGGADDLGGYFSAPNLAVKVYRAMATAELSLKKTAS